MCALYKQSVNKKIPVARNPLSKAIAHYCKKWRAGEKRGARIIGEALKTKKRKVTQPVVRVLLDEGMPETKHWTIESVHGFIIEKKGKKGTKAVTVHDAQLAISATKKAVYINGKATTSFLTIIKPRKEYIRFNGKAYKGTFITALWQDTLYLMNALPLEDYITAVVHSETWPGWPLEVNKVFAIASRSYVIAMMRQAERSKRIYHIKDTNQHQRYNLYGIEHPDCVARAVHQTKGIFLGYDNEPITAMFDCCCGGVIPAHIAHVNFKQAPYLARTYPCTFCKTCSLYQWQAEYDIFAFERIITREKKLKQRINNVAVAKKDRAGLVQEVNIQGKGRGSVLCTFTGKHFYSLFDDVKSFHFTVRKKADKVIIAGRGFGHHLGLCQWGAERMVRKGWDYRSILQFFYPDTVFMRLS